MKGRTGVFAHSGDRRFAYCLFLPESRQQQRRPALVVVIHDTLRNFMECRDGFADFGETHGCLVLAPLFPIGVLGDGNPDGYKYLIEQDIRYDLVLYGMVDAVAQATGCDGARFCLQGYSASRWIFPNCAVFRCSCWSRSRQAERRTGHAALQPVLELGGRASGRQPD